MVATADHTGKKPQQDPPGHFHELMESPCTNHTYPIKTSIRTASSSSAFYDRPADQRRKKAKEQRPRKGAKQTRIRMTEG